MTIVYTSVRISFLLLILNIICSCNNRITPEELGKQYCDCLTKQMLIKSEFPLAQKKCDSIYTERSYYFKIFKNRINEDSIPADVNDSSRAFIGRFMNYMNKNCPYGW